MLLFLPPMHPVLYNLANGDHSRGLAEGCHHPLMEEERFKKRLLQLLGNNPTVSPRSYWIVFNGPAGWMSEYHLKNLATRASWFYVGPFKHRADFHRVPTESIYCLRRLPCYIRLSRSRSSLVDSRVDWPTREILQTSQGAAP